MNFKRNNCTTRITCEGSVENTFEEEGDTYFFSIKWKRSYETFHVFTKLNNNQENLLSTEGFLIYSACDESDRESVWFGIEFCFFFQPTMCK